MSKVHVRGGRFYEFFAGGGMARAGLGKHWTCLFSNDVDPRKVSAYARAWKETGLTPRDVGNLTTTDLPGVADLAWASFPCQDLSLAGNGAGLGGARSGTFWPFWNLIKALNKEGRAPTLIVLENVCGALTSHSGRDFQALIAALADENYRYGALIVDAVHFVPQSRPRLFIVAVKDGLDLPATLTGKAYDPPWTTQALLKACDSLSEEQKQRWLWWNLPKPPARKNVFSDLIETDPTSVRWHTKAETKRLIDLMSLINCKKLLEAKRSGRRVIGAIYKRTRVDAAGIRAQRAEVRFDDIAGCLRTPVGGSSRQLIMEVQGDNVRSRLLSTREAARLMGLPETYPLPENYNEAYHLAGDGLVVPVVRHLTAHLLEPIIELIRVRQRDAA